MSPVCGQKKEFVTYVMAAPGLEPWPTQPDLLFASERVAEGPSAVSSKPGHRFFARERRQRPAVCPHPFPRGVASLTSPGGPSGDGCCHEGVDWAFTPPPASPSWLAVSSGCAAMPCFHAFSFQQSWVPGISPVLGKDGWCPGRLRSSSGFRLQVGSLLRWLCASWTQGPALRLRRARLPGEAAWPHGRACSRMSRPGDFYQWKSSTLGGRR